MEKINRQRLEARGWWLQGKRKKETCYKAGESSLSEALTRVAVHGAERSMCSLCQSFPSLRQFLSCIDVASHYCKVPINPPFIRPRVLIRFFSLLTSLTLSGYCCLIPIFSPPFFIGKEMSSYISVASLLALQREKGGSLRGEGLESCYPLFWGLKWKICLNAKKALMVT